WHEIAGLAPLMALIVLIGVVPGPFLDRIRPSVGEIDKNIQSQRGSMTLAAADVVRDRGRGADRGFAGAAGGLGLALADRHVRLGCPQRLAGVLRPPCGPAQRPDPAGPGPRRAGR